MKPYRIRTDQAIDKEKKRLKNPILLNIETSYSLSLLLTGKLQ